MVTEVKKAPKFRRKSSQEIGFEPTPKFQDNDREAFERLKANFPRHAELGIRRTKGKNRISGVDMARASSVPLSQRKDFFDLRGKYLAFCPYPKKNSKKDAQGTWEDRCTWKPPQNDEDVEKKYIDMYVDPSQRKGLYEDVTLMQFAVMKHCEEDHWDWFVDECGRKEVHNGKVVVRPPFNVTVPVPVWGEVE